jgi:hypothetical protein
MRFFHLVFLAFVFSRRSGEKGTKRGELGNPVGIAEDPQGNLRLDKGKSKAVRSACGHSRHRGIEG